jgi:hypothetical protein
MDFIPCRRWAPGLALAAVVVVYPLLAFAADTRAKASKTAEADAAVTTTDMFEAMKANLIEVKLIPKDSTEANIQITNKTDKPLSVKLPAAFAGVPVLAAQNANAAPKTTSSTTSSTRTQGVGGGYMGGGIMNIAPEKIAKVTIPIVCLEHGKSEPRPSVNYEIRPLESFTDKPGVLELCTMLGSGQIDQRAAQAAAWNLNNDMSWDALAAKRVKHVNGTSEPYFSRQAIQFGMQLAARAVQTAEQRRLAQASTDDLSNPAEKQ